MLSALASGTLIRDPKSGISASGTRWCNTTIDTLESLQGEIAAMITGRIPNDQDRALEIAVEFIGLQKRHIEALTQQVDYLADKNEELSARILAMHLDSIPAERCFAG